MGALLVALVIVLGSLAWYVTPTDNELTGATRYSRFRQAANQQKTVQKTNKTPRKAFFRRNFKGRQAPPKTPAKTYSGALEAPAAKDTVLFTKAGPATKTLVNGVQNLLEFKIVAGSGDVTIISWSFKVNTVGDANVSNFELVNTETGEMVQGTGGGGGGGGGGFAAPAFSEVTIAANTSKSYVLRGLVNGAGSDASVVTTELRQEDVATAGENTIGVNLVNEGLPIHHSLVGNGPVAGVVGTNEQVAVAEVGTLTFTKMGPGSTVLLGGVQTLLEVEFYAQNEDIEIDKLYVSVNTQGSAASVGQITLENEYGEPLGTGFLNSLNRVEFDPDLTIPEDQNVKVVVKGEILNPFGSVFTVITASGVTGIGGSSGAAVIVPSALFAHHTLTSDTVGEVQVGTITLAKEFGVSEFLAAGGTQDVLKFSIIPQGEHVELHRLNFNFDRNGVTFGSNVRLSNQDYDTVWEGSPTDVMKMDFTFPISMAKGQKHTYTLQADLEGVDTVGDSIATTLSDAVVSGKSSGAMLTSDGLPIMHTRIK